MECAAEFSGLLGWGNMDNGLWSSVIRVKYLKTYNSTQWLRHHHLCLSRASAVWTSIGKSIAYVKKGIKWKIGNGTELLVGVDPFIGDKGIYRLPRDLIAELHNRRLMVLSQFFISGRDVPSECWRSAADLNLPLRWHMEWDRYVTKLAFSGIRLGVSPDQLVWDSPGSMGILSVRNAYNTMASFKLNPPITSW